MEEMTISVLADATGTTPDTIRYYERIGLLGEVRRSASGYRLFDGADVQRIAFIRRAQRFGLQLEQIAELLAIKDRGLCPCGHARQFLTERLEQLEQQIEAFDQLRAEIVGLLDGEPATPEGTWWPCRFDDYENERRSG